MTSTLPTVVVVGVTESDVTVFVALVAIFCCTIAGAADAGVGVTPSAASPSSAASHPTIPRTIAFSLTRQSLIMPPEDRNDRAKGPAPLKSINCRGLRRYSALVCRPQAGAKLIGWWQ